MLDNFDVFVVGFGQVDVLDGVGIGINCNQGEISSLGQSSQPKRYLEGPQSGFSNGSNNSSPNFGHRQTS